MTPPASRGARVLDRMIRGYQHLSAGRLPRCRFYPTCSNYAREAVAAHGAVTGSWLAVRRLGRCHPLGGHGFDPVPAVVPALPSPAGRAPQRRAHRLRGADPC